MSYNNGPTIVRDGLVLYYDPASPKSYVSGSTTMYDLSPTGTTASLVNGVGYATSSQGVFNFDGVNDYISFARPSSIVTSGSLTVCMYAKWDTVGTTTSTIKVLMDNNHSDSPRQGFVIQDRPDLNKRLSFGVKQEANPNYTLYATSSFIVGDDNWYNIAATHDGTVSRLYINGVLDGFLTESNGLATVQPNINIGRWQSGGGSRYFTGSIGQVLLYNRALSATEVKQNYDATKSRYPAVNPYVFNEDFEGASFPNWRLSNFAIDSSNQLFGSKSLRVVSGNNEASSSFAPQDEVWVFYAYRLLISGETFIRLCQLYTTSQGIGASLGIWGSSTRVEGVGKDLFITPQFTPSNQVTYVWMHYVRGTGANSVAEFYVSSTPQRPASPSYSWSNSSATSPVNRIYFTTVGATLDLKFDYFRISKNEIGSYPI